MLELRKITKDYKVADTTATVLKGISLTLRNSEFVSVLGPSGCGKTTMLNIIGGLDQYTTGDLIINGVSTKNYKDHDWDTYRNHTIGFVFQSYNLIPHQTVLKNVELALSIGGISKKERRKKAVESLEKVGLKDHLNKKPNQLSGGQCQRVSIARALVTDPDIILADEPTGALDSETSVQVMEILREVSKDRLVLMVTHNQELAEKYSTRIVKMLDGTITYDSNPVLEEEHNELLDEKKKEQESLDSKEKRKQEKKASMSLKTGILLSASNLLTKKRRTFITAFACSIGIIGISVILSVSSGMQSYVSVLQEDSSSSNFISISENASSMLTNGNSEEVTLEEYPENTDGVYIYEEDTNKEKKTQILSQDYIDYIEQNIHKDSEGKDLILGVSYTRSVGMNLIMKNSSSYTIASDDSFTELLSNDTYMASQYTILSGDKMPTEYNEVSLVVDSHNRISKKILDGLGIEYNSDATKISYSDLLNKEFRLVSNDDYYIEQDYGEKSIYRVPNTDTELKESYDKGETVKIVSVIRQNKDASNTWVDVGIAYSEKLTEHILETNQNSKVVSYQKENEDYDVLTGKKFEAESSSFGSLFGSSSTYKSNLTLLGGSSTPSSIKIYPKDFDSKDKIIKILDSWNDSEIYKRYGNEKDEEGNYIALKYKVEYTDFSEMLVSMLGSLIDIITYALVAFSAISLVVSSIMIAIITYASVIERTKEIGTIRSLGGRKTDVSLVFIAEACIIGLVSAVIALVATLGINGIINLILGALVGVSTIASLNWSTAIWMVVLSVGLNLIASLIPAHIASKKDPVVALRTE